MHRYSHWPIHLALSIICALMLVPFLWVLKTSLTGENIFVYPPSLLPENPHLFYYVEVWYSIPFFRYLVNSVVVSAIVVVANVFLNTNAAAAGGLIGAMIVARLMFGKTDLTMVLNGALAGLVAITAEPADPTPLVATLIGMAGGALVVFSIVFFDKIKIDDPVGAISVHGVVGLFGVLVVPLTDGDATFMGQLIGAGVIFAWVFGTSFIVWMVIKMVMGIRISEEEEYNGADLAECGLEAYPEFVGAQGSGK